MEILTKLLNYIRFNQIIYKQKLMDISSDKANLKTKDETGRSTTPNSLEIEEEQNGNNANRNENNFESGKNINIRESEDNILFSDEIEEKAKYFATNDNDINENVFYRSNYDYDETSIINKLLDPIEQEVTNYTNI